MAAFLILQDGTQVAIEDGMTVGRVAGCSVVIDDTKVSRRHARLISQGGVVEVEDLKSSNGTFMNGARITKRMLRDGDEVIFGRTPVTFRESTGAAAPAAKGPEPAAGEDLFGDDLFGDDEADEISPAASAPAPSPAPKPEAKFEPRTSPKPERFEPEIEVRSGRDAPSPEAEQEQEEVLEFADDDVVVVKRSLPETGKPKQRKPEPAATRDGGVLQFNKIEHRSGIAAQDLSQMSVPMRALLFLVALAVAVGLFWASMQLMG